MPGLVPATEEVMKRNPMGRMAVLAAILVVGGPLAAFAAGSKSDDSASDDSNYDAAVKAVKANDFAGAVGLLVKVVQKDPKNADAWNYLGFSDRKLGKFPESLDAYQKALAIQPKHLGATEYLGELYVQMGQTDNANAQLAKLEKLCGSSCDEYKELKTAISSGKAAMLDAPSSN
jgi:tetratricopeptide (TPR) repeat protein